MNELQKHRIPFTQIPNELINDTELTARTKVVYIYMASKPDGWRFSANRIAPALKMSYKTVIQCLSSLRKTGWIGFQKQGDGKSLYTLYFSPECKNDTVAKIQSVKTTPCRNDTVSKIHPFSNTGENSNTKIINNTDEKKKNKDSFFSRGEKKKSHFKTIKKKLFNQVDESDMKKFTIQELMYFKTARGFFNIFSQAHRELDIPTTHLDNARFGTFVDPIRLMYQKDGITREHFIMLYNFFLSNTENAQFWKSNVRSTSKLRAQTTQLLFKAKQDEKQRKNNRRNQRTRTANDDPTYSAEWVANVFRKLNTAKSA